MMDVRRHKALVGSGATKWQRQLRWHDEAARTRGSAQKPGARGSTLTEFAFILPVMCMCLFGVIDFARALYSYHFVSDAAREASRWASVRGNTCRDYTDACPARDTDVSDYVMSIVPSGIDKKALSVDSDNAVRPAGVASSCPKKTNPAARSKLRSTTTLSSFSLFSRPLP